MAGTSVIKQLPPKDLRNELRQFVLAVSKQSAPRTELIRKSFTLLKSLPASKHAVFEYFSSFYEKSVPNFMQELESELKNQQVQSTFDHSVIDEIHQSLYNFLTYNPIGWSYIVSKWSLELLGALSSKYSDRGRSPVNGSLSDSLQQWMSCKATRSLLDLSIYCLQFLEEKNDSFRCITFLLDTCVRNTPHFDWAVAHIGNCFPQTVISRVLVAGLHEFAFNQGATNRPKLKSVVDILIHLAGCHRMDIEKAFKDLFQWSLDKKLENDERGGMLEKNGTVPYLVTLASLSHVLLSPLSEVALQTLCPEVVEGLLSYGQDWLQFTTSLQAILNMVIHLIISVPENADQILFLLLEVASYKTTQCSSVAEELIELLINELAVLSRSNTPKIPFLESVGKRVDDLFPMLLSGKELHMNTTVSMISFIGCHQSSVLPRCVSFVLLRSTDDVHLACVVKLSQGYKCAQVLAPAIKLALDHTNQQYHKLVWANLIKLLKWEASGTLISLPILEAVYSNLTVIGELLCAEKDVQTAHTIAELLSKPVLEYSEQPTIPLLRALIQALIAYFYMCVMGSEWIEQLKGVRVACSMMKKLCSYGGGARSFALRELLESSLFRMPSILFGAVPPLCSSLLQSHVSLLEENNKQGHLAILAQKHSRVFHAGVIGTGKRKRKPECPLEKDRVVHNTQLLMGLLRAGVQQTEAPQGSLDPVIAIALLLVELISPDVMYNGLPWPEEDFCKVTVERDLAIRRILDSKPLVWSLLTFIAHHRPALCYCSVILRAVVATLISEWSSTSQESKDKLLTTTNRLVQLMSLGQLLPPPFTALSDVFPHIPSQQVVTLLRECVWNYMRDHVPSPALFGRDAAGTMWRDTATSRPPRQYTEPMRAVMLHNISSLGPLFYTLFVKGQVPEDD